MTKVPKGPWETRKMVQETKVGRGKKTGAERRHGRRKTKGRESRKWERKLRGIWEQQEARDTNRGPAQEG